MRTRRRRRRRLVWLVKGWEVWVDMNGSDVETLRSRAVQGCRENKEAKTLLHTLYVCNQISQKSIV